MKRHELGGHLRSQGRRLQREGARRLIYTNPARETKAPVPRHSEIDSRLAVKIFHQLGVEPIR